MNLSQFLENDLQNKLDQAVDLEILPSPETTPYQNKYEARKIYQDLIALPILSLEPTQTSDQNQETKNLKNTILFLITFFYGNNYFDTEEYTLAGSQFKIAEKYLNNVTDKELLSKFNQYLLQFYKNYGFMDVEQDHLQEGLQKLELAQKYYTLCKTDFSKQSHTIVHFRGEFSEYEKLKSLSDVEKQKILQPLIKGGVSIDSIESKYTQVIFYLAQTYTKIGNHSKAAHFSLETLKRQVKAFKDGSNKDFNYVDFTNNILGISAYYLGNKKYRQVIDLISSAERIVPNSMRAEHGSFKTLLGQNYCSLFRFNVDLIAKAQIKDEIIDSINEVEANFDESSFLNKKENLTLFLSYDDSKKYFRQAFDFLKEAEKLLPLDGYVTDYCEIIKETSRLYSHTLVLENDNARIEAIQDRRLELLNKTLSNINEKYYEKQFVEISAEIADINGNNFERYNKIFTSSGKQGKKVTKFAKEALIKWDFVIEYFEKIKEDDPKSYINCLYSKARILTQWPEQDKNIVKSNLAGALSCYEKVRATFQKMKQKTGFLDEASERELVMSDEFCKMLPLRISSVGM